MDSGDFSRQLEIEILSHFSEITSLTDLDQVLQQVVRDTPRLIGASGCSVYLLPDYVPRYNQQLLRLKPGVQLSPHSPFQPDNYQEVTPSRSSASLSSWLRTAGSTAPS